jgi:hypothetical protein
MRSLFDVNLDVKLGFLPKPGSSIIESYLLKFAANNYVVLMVFDGERVTFEEFLVKLFRLRRLVHLGTENFNNEEVSNDVMDILSASDPPTGIALREKITDIWDLFANVADYEITCHSETSSEAAFTIQELWPVVVTLEPARIGFLEFIRRTSPNRLIEQKAAKIESKAPESDNLLELLDRLDKIKLDILPITRRLVW